METDKENYLKLVEENQDLKRQIEFYERQAEAFKREMLKERLWRIDFQMDFLRQLSDQTRKELAELEAKHGRQAESAVSDQG
jgi:hypothetical protein